MRQAPPVLVPVGFFLGGPVVAGALALLAVWGALQALPPGEPRWGVHGLWLVLGIACAGVTLVWGRREALPPGRLRWDGQGWWYAATGACADGADEDGADEVPVEPQVLWDAGGGLLLQLRSPEAHWRLPRHTWLTAGQLQSAARWHGLRCALYGQDIL